MSTSDTTGGRARKRCDEAVMAMITKEERDELEAVAEQEQRSLSATLRMLYLRGLQQYKADNLSSD